MWLIFRRPGWGSPRPSAAHALAYAHQDPPTEPQTAPVELRSDDLSACPEGMPQAGTSTSLGMCRPGPSDPEKLSWRVDQGNRVQPPPEPLRL